MEENNALHSSKMLSCPVCAALYVKKPFFLRLTLYDLGYLSSIACQLFYAYNGRVNLDSRLYILPIDRCHHCHEYKYT